MKRLFVAMVAVLLAASAAIAAQAPVGIKENFQVTAITPGLGNRCRPGRFFPVAVEMTAMLEPVSGQITVRPESGGSDVPVYVVPFDLSPGTLYRYFAYPFNYGNYDSYVLTITDSKGKLLRGEQLIMDSRDWQYYYIAIMGSQGITGMSTRQPTAALCGLDTAFITLDYLPNNAAGYDCADAILWAHPDPADISVHQMNALGKWVLGGGRIILCIGDAWQPAAAAPLLRDLIPGVVTGMENTSEFSELASAGGAPFDPDRKMAIAVLDKVRGEVLMKAGNRPLVVKGKAGFGEVIFVAFDPTRNPFAQWDGAARFWNSVLEVGITPPATTRTSEQPAANYNVSRGGLSRSGSGQGFQDKLLDAVNRFPEVQPISFSFVIGFLAAYVILVGPVDYFVLKKLKHLEWTWFTFPAIALAATVVAFVVISSGRTVRVHINQFTIADWSADGKARRVYTTSAVISPRDVRYDISYEVPNSLMWIGQAQDSRGLGAFVTMPYNVVDHPERGMSFSDLLMPVWSPKTFCGRWSGVQSEVAPLTASLGIEDGKLAGSVTNSGEAPLENVTVVHVSGACVLGRIMPGDTVEIGEAHQYPYANFIGDTPGKQPAWAGGEQFWAGARNIMLRASFARDQRFFPMDYFSQAQLADAPASGSGVDLPSECSVRALCDAGQAVVLATSDTCVQPVVAVEKRLFRKSGALKKRDSTVYRVCVAVPRS